MMPDKKFAKELEIFRNEQAIGQQYFFSWLQMRTEFRDRKLLDRLNDTPLFWITTHHALIVATFVVLGRVFDQRSQHNIDSLLRVAIDNRQIFTRQALKERRIREGVDHKFAAEYVANKYEPTATDFRQLRAEVAQRRKVYAAKFKDVRDKIYAHREIADIDAVNALLAKAELNEMQAVFGFLHALHEALWELFTNGRQPILHLPAFQLPPKDHHGDSPAEMVAHDAAHFFRAFMARCQ
jgi:hypothetical protein